MLIACTGYDAVSLQPNAGSQGEYAGLLAIKAYHESRGDDQRDVCLIPSSAHGTNPASAAMAGMKIVVVKCDDDGNVDLADLKTRAAEHADRLLRLKDGTRDGASAGTFIAANGASSSLCFGLSAGCVRICPAKFRAA